MDDKCLQLMERFAEEKNYITAQSLSNFMKCSTKTIRNMIQRINAEIETKGAKIESKQRYGYRFIIIDDTAWQHFWKKEQDLKHRIPQTFEQRNRYLMISLLSRQDYINLSDLGDELFVSVQTLTNVLRVTEELLKQFHIRIDRKPYYGIHAIGNEFDKRCCLIWHFASDESFIQHHAGIDPITLQAVSARLQCILNQQNLKLTDISFRNLTLYLNLSIARIKQGLSIKQIVDPVSNVQTRKEYQISERIWKELCILEAVEATEPEIYYTGIYIAGKRTQGDRCKENFVISERTDSLVMQMLNIIYDTCRIELRNNFYLRMLLNQHLASLDIRMRYGIPVDPPMLEETKRNYLFGYTLADHACVVLREHYHQSLPENELGWLALIFQVGIEEKSEPNRLNILIVCASGKASSHLLKTRFQQEFGKYIQNTEICTALELKDRDLSGIDYIFTTVPVTVSVDVPILEIHDFIKRYELSSVKKALQRSHLNFLEEFYNPNYFFTEVKGDTKEAILREIISRLQKQTKIPDGFYEAVLKREYLGATDYGNYVAIPHPYKIMTDETIVCVSVLEKPVKWTENLVQVVILVALSAEENSNTANFYDATTQLISDQNAIQEFLQNPAYETLLSLLYECQNTNFHI